MAAANHYEALCVDSDATGEEIREAYRALAKAYHPDRGGCGKRFAAVSAAYDVLKDPVLRKEYDDSQQNMQQRLSVGGYTIVRPSGRLGRVLSIATATVRVVINDDGCVKNEDIHMRRLHPAPSSAQRAQLQQRIRPMVASSAANKVDGMSDDTLSYFACSSLLWERTAANVDLLLSSRDDALSKTVAKTIANITYRVKDPGTFQIGPHVYRKLKVADLERLGVLQLANAIGATLPNVECSSIGYGAYPEGPVADDAGASLARQQQEAAAQAARLAAAAKQAQAAAWTGAPATMPPYTPAFAASQPFYAQPWPGVPQGYPVPGVPQGYPQATMFPYANHQCATPAAGQPPHAPPAGSPTVPVAEPVTQNPLPQQQLLGLVQLSFRKGKDLSVLYNLSVPDTSGLPTWVANHGYVLAAHSPTGDWVITCPSGKGQSTGRRIQRRSIHPDKAAAKFISPVDCQWGDMIPGSFQAVPSQWYFEAVSPSPPGGAPAAQGMPMPGTPGQHPLPQQQAPPPPHAPPPQQQPPPPQQPKQRKTKPEAAMQRPNGKENTFGSALPAGTPAAPPPPAAAPEPLPNEFFAVFREDGGLVLKFAEVVGDGTEEHVLTFVCARDGGVHLEGSTRDVSALRQTLPRSAWQPRPEQRSVGLQTDPDPGGSPRAPAPLEPSGSPASESAPSLRGTWGRAAPAATQPAGNWRDPQPPRAQGGDGDQGAAAAPAGLRRDDSFGRHGQGRGRGAPPPWTTASRYKWGAAESEPSDRSPSPVTPTQAAASAEAKPWRDAHPPGGRGRGAGTAGPTPGDAPPPRGGGGLASAQPGSWAASRMGAQPGRGRGEAAPSGPVWAGERAPTPESLSDLDSAVAEDEGGHCADPHQELAAGATMSEADIVLQCSADYADHRVDQRASAASGAGGICRGCGVEPTAVTRLLLKVGLLPPCHPVIHALVREGVHNQIDLFELISFSDEAERVISDPRVLEQISQLVKKL